MPISALPPERPEIIGHRGAPRAYTENTLAAFGEALARGADAVELDVHLTRDGTIIVHHDAVPRAAPTDDALRGRPFDSLTLAEVQTFRLDGGLAIPTLEEVLGEVNGRAVVYVEVKGRNAERAVADLLAARTGWSAVHAFDHRVVRRVRELVPTLRGGVLLESYLIHTSAAMLAAGASDLWQRWQFIDEALVDEVHHAGGRLIAWTVNDVAVAERLGRMGVDGICTDLPGEMRLALRGRA